MPLQILFGDDEHTAKDGPYSRVLKTRKWLYVSAALGTIVALGLYDPMAAKSVLKLVALPEWLVRQALFAGLAYLSAQYLLLCGQLLVTYDIILRERLGFRREDELRVGRESVRDAQRELIAYEDQRPLVPLKELVAADEEYRNAEGRLTRLLKDAAEAPTMVTIGTKQFDLTENQVEQARAEVDSAKRRLELMRRDADRLEKARSLPDPVRRSLEESAKAAVEALVALEMEDPARRQGYRLMEVVIDGMRLAPPVIWSAVVILALARPPIPS